MNSDPTNSSLSDSHDPMSDQQWLSSLFDRYQRPLIVYAARLLSMDWERAKDCVQDVFLRLCKEPRDKVEAHVEAWLFKCCRNRAMDFHRKESTMAVHYSLETATPLVARAPSTGDTLVLEEEKVLLQNQIAQLPSNEQEVLMLRMQQGLSYKQIADVLDLSVSHVGVLIHQAVARLKQQMANA